MTSAVINVEFSLVPLELGPSTMVLHKDYTNSGGDSGPDLSLDKSASLERLFSLACVSLAEASKLDLSFGCFGGDYTSSCPPRLVSAKDIPDAMVWRHPDVAIDDPRPVAGSFNMGDVRRLRAHVIKLRDMPESTLVLSRLSRVWKSRVCDSVLRGVDGNVMGIHDFLCLPEWTGAKVQEEPYLDRKASTSGATSSHVAKCTRSALAQSFGSTTRPSLFVGDDNENSRGNGVMADDASGPSAGVSRPRPSSKHAPSFRDVFGDAIHTDFFLFSDGPYYATYPEDGVAGNYEFTREEWDAPYRPIFEVLIKEVFKDPAVCKNILDQFPIPGEMVGVESLSDDQLTAKMSVLHCMMMSHGGELFVRYRGLNQSHH
nr:hypothetical protein [Tanacetum cinerariifolium]